MTNLVMFHDVSSQFFSLTKSRPGMSVRVDFLFFHQSLTQIISKRDMYLLFVIPFQASVNAPHWAFKVQFAEACTQQDQSRQYVGKYSFPADVWTLFDLFHRLWQPPAALCHVSAHPLVIFATHANQVEHKWPPDVSLWLAPERMGERS